MHAAVKLRWSHIKKHNQPVQLLQTRLKQINKMGPEVLTWVTNENMSYGHMIVNTNVTNHCWFYMRICWFEDFVPFSLQMSRSWLCSRATKCPAPTVRHQPAHTHTPAYTPQLTHTPSSHTHTTNTPQLTSVMLKNPKVNTRTFHRFFVKATIIFHEKMKQQILV